MRGPVVRRSEPQWVWVCLIAARTQGGFLSEPSQRIGRRTAAEEWKLLHETETMALAVARKKVGEIEMLNLVVK